MTCRHPPDHVVIKHDCDGLPDPLELSWRECLDCGAWLPLGPANDRGVEHEIRAAEIALAVVSNGYYPTWPDRHSDEILGWSLAESNMQHHSNAWLAGYLAREIATHKEPKQ